MNISRKDIDANNAIVTVSIVKEDYAEKVDKTLRDYRKRANMPGFRPGHVPLGMIKKMYGKAILADEINELVADSLTKYIEENDLRILGQPLPNENEQVEQNFDTQETFEFKFDLGIAPEFDVVLDESVVLNVYDIKVSDEMIDNQIKSYTSRFGKYDQVDVVEEKDMVKGTLTEMDGAEAKEGGIVVENAVLTPAYMKDEKQRELIVGKNKGDAVVFNPLQAFENEAELSSLLHIKKEEVAEMKSDFKLEIEGITRYTESEMDQEFFDKVYEAGTVKSEEEFRQKIADDVKENLKSDSDYRFSLDTRNYFVEQFKGLSFPEEFLKRWLLAANEEMTAEKLEEDYPKMIEDLIWHIVKDKVSADNEVVVEFSDVEAYARKVAAAQFAQYGMIGLGDEMLDGYVQDLLKNEESIRNFYDRAQEEKAIEVIRQKVKTKSKKISIEDFNKLFEEAGA